MSSPGPTPDAPGDSEPVGRGLTPALEAALETEGRRLEALEDPAQVVREASDFFAVLDREVARLVGSVRLDAIGALRAQGWSHQQIADSCGLTRQRVSQLIAEAVRAGR